MHRRRAAASLVEILVVLAIIGTTLGMLLPALQQSQTRARETECQNNIRQMAIALSQWQGVQRKFPELPIPGCVGGWSYDILDFMEEPALHRRVAVGVPVDSVMEVAYHRPRSMSCPESPATMSSSPPMDASHFVLVVRPNRTDWRLFDAPVDARHPWLSVPDYTETVLRQMTGPHRGGFHYTSSDSGVDWIGSTD